LSKFFISIEKVLRMFDNI